MTLPRSSLISVSDTPYYHCVSRCVRRAFLCGTDHYSGQSYEHRRDWIESKLQHVASVFAIRICAYAVMSNHYHVVLHIRTDVADQWTTLEVVKQWHKVFRGTPLSQRYATGKTLLECEQTAVKELAKQWRTRLSSISWFMKVVNEDIARKANAEDKCTGSFWESRFKSQALLDDRALLSCMAYVDLNPIRARMAKTPETSDYTSVKTRIESLINKTKTPWSLERFVSIRNDVIGIPFKLQEYLELIDYSGRLVRKGKRGSMSESLPPILERLALDATSWFTLTTEFETRFRQWVGSEQIVAQVYRDHGYQRIPDMATHRDLLSP